VIDLEPAPLVRGVVTREGAPERAARVVLRAPDPVSATLRSFGERMDLLFQGAIAPPPAAWAEAVTDDRGRFELTAWQEFQGGAAYRLEVASEDGAWAVSRVLLPGEREVEIALEPARPPLGRIAIDLGARRLPLPVQVLVDGGPRDPFLLAPDARLEIAELVEGSWHLTARWHGEALIEELRVDLRPEAELALELPAGALEGQGAEERERLGR
jgi:hypothetical protein